MEHVHRQLLDQLGLAHASGAHKDKGHRLALGGDAHSPPADGSGYGLDGLVLADQVLLEPVLQLGQALVFGLLNLAGGDFGPQLNDPGQMFHRQRRGALGVQVLQFLLKLDLPALDGGQALIILAGILLRVELIPLPAQGGQLPLVGGLPVLVGLKGLLSGGVAGERLMLGESRSAAARCA